MTHLAFVGLCVCVRVWVCASLHIAKPDNIVQSSENPTSFKNSTHSLNERAQPVKASKLVWLFGSSIDSNLVSYACEKAGAPLFVPGKGNSWKIGPISDYEGYASNATKLCTFDDVTVVHTMHPGLTPPPYIPWGVAFAGTAEELAKSAILQMQQLFGVLPDAVVVDSSLWDIGGWWFKDGHPKKSWAFPTSWISQWSDTTLPNFLAFLQSKMPETHIAFRSAPTIKPVCNHDGYRFACEGDRILSTMYNRILRKVEMPSLQLFGKYHFLDFREIVFSRAAALGGNWQDYYRDEFHPGSELSLAFMEAVIDWAKGLP